MAFQSMDAERLVRVALPAAALFGGVLEVSPKIDIHVGETSSAGDWLIRWLMPSICRLMLDRSAAQQN